AASTADDEDFPDLGYSNLVTGQCVLTWAVQTGGTVNDYDISGVQLIPSPITYGTPFPIEAGAAHCSRPRNSLYAGSAGTFLVVAYTTNPTFPSTVDATNVETVVFNAAGDPPALVETLLAADTTFDDLLPVVTINTGASQALIVFQDQFNVAGTDIDIRARAVRLLGAGPDLVVESITPSPAVPVQGQSVTFQVRIQNVGSATTAVPFTVGFFLNS